jgi:hypothetical protein
MITIKKTNYDGFIVKVEDRDDTLNGTYFATSDFVTNIGSNELTIVSKRLNIVEPISTVLVFETPEAAEFSTDNPEELYQKLSEIGFINFKPGGVTPDKYAKYKITGQTNTTLPAILTSKNGMPEMFFDASPGGGQFNIIGFDPAIHFIACVFANDSQNSSVIRNPTYILESPFGTYVYTDLSNEIFINGGTIIIGQHNF